MDDAFPMNAFCRHQRKTILQVKPHLVTKNGFCPRSGTVAFGRAVGEDVLQKVVVSLHRLEYDFGREGLWTNPGASSGGANLSNFGVLGVGNGTTDEPRRPLFSWWRGDEQWLYAFKL